MKNNILTPQGRAILFALIVIVPTLLALMSSPFLSGMMVLPHLTLLFCIMWAMFRPDAMPPWLGFLIGLASDLVLNLPLGVNATLMPLIIMLFGLIRWRLPTGGFKTSWFYATCLIFLYQTAYGFLVGLATNTANANAFFAQAVTTSLAFPLLRIMLASLGRWLDKPAGLAG